MKARALIGVASLCASTIVLTTVATPVAASSLATNIVATPGDERVRLDRSAAEQHAGRGDEVDQCVGRLADGHLGRTVEHDAERAVLVMIDEQDDRPGEGRVVEDGHRDEQLAGVPGRHGRPLRSTSGAPRAGGHFTVAEPRVVMPDRTVPRVREVRHVRERGRRRDRDGEVLDDVSHGQSVRSLSRGASCRKTLDRRTAGG